MVRGINGNAGGRRQVEMFKSSRIFIVLGLVHICRVFSGLSGHEMFPKKLEAYVGHSPGESKEVEHWEDV